MQAFLLQVRSLVLLRVWTGGSGCSGKLAPCMCKATHCTCASSPCIFKLVWSMFYDLSSKFSFKSFWLNFEKHGKIIYFVQKRLQTSAHNVLECRTKVKSCFCMVKCAKIQHLSFAGGFAGTPSLAVGLFYTCILQGASQAQGPCCTNPNWSPGGFGPVEVTIQWGKRTRSARRCHSANIVGSTSFWAQISRTFGQPICPNRKS